MSEGTAPSSKFKIICIIAIIWNVIGVVMYLASTQITPDLLAESYGQTYADLYAAKPAWSTSAFAIAVFAGLVGSIGLLMRKAWSFHILILSLAGVVIHDAWALMSGAFNHVGMFDKVMTLVVLIIAIFLVWFAHKNKSNGTLT